MALEPAAAPIRIDVSSAGGAIDGQTRAYAEYRLFSRLAQARGRVDFAGVALIDASEHTGRAVCSITVTLRNGTRVRVSAKAPHIYDAIDRAVDQAAKGVPAT